MVFVHVLCLLLPVFSICSPARPAITRSINYKNCGTTEIKAITMSPCPSEPCTFHKGVNVSVGIDFISEAPASAITAKVHGIVAGIPVAYPLPKADGCSGCNMTCPLQPGEHWYQNILPVLQMYPDIKVVVKWELIDGNGHQIVCFLFPMAITG